MDFIEAMELARENTKILRARKNILYTFGPTKLPYVSLSDSEDGAIYIREGEVTTQKPQVMIPGNDHSFEGFDLDGMDAQGMIPVFLARGIMIPPANYVNKSGQSRIFRGEMAAAIDQEMDRLESANDIKTGLIQAPEGAWKLSVLFYVALQATRSAPQNVAEHFERLRLQGGGHL